MATQDPRITALITALGTHVGISDLALGEDNVCRLVQDGTVVVDIEHQPGTDNAQVFSIVGTHPGSNVALLHRLLEANLFGQGTGGSQLGLDEERGEIVLSHAVDLTTMTAERFISLLDAFVGYAQTWSQEILDLQNAEEEAPESGEASTEASSPEFIRV